jgi:hypothetical protein
LIWERERLTIGGQKLTYENVVENVSRKTHYLKLIGYMITTEMNNDFNEIEAEPTIKDGRLRCRR